MVFPTTTARNDTYSEIKLVKSPPHGVTRNKKTRAARSSSAVSPQTSANSRSRKVALSSPPTTDSDASPRQELFRKTVGPLKEVFLIYNSQGRSKGMALVSFQRSGDAAVARAKYDGKYIDRRRPIKIEIVVDSTYPAVSPPPARTQPSLLGRLGGIAAASPSLSVPAYDHAPNGTFAPLGPRKQRPVFSAPLAVAPRRRQKKGPRRVKKSLAQLDQEMEDYRAAATSFALNGK